MNEVDFTGWARTEENIDKIKNDKLYRLYLHFYRMFIALKTKRFYHFNWFNIRGFLFNEIKQF